MILVVLNILTALDSRRKIVEKRIHTAIWEVFSILFATVHYTYTGKNNFLACLVFGFPKLLTIVTKKVVLIFINSGKDSSVIFLLSTSP